MILGKESSGVARPCRLSLSSPIRMNKKIADGDLFFAFIFLNNIHVASGIRTIHALPLLQLDTHAEPSEGSDHRLNASDLSACGTVRRTLDYDHERR